MGTSWHAAFIEIPRTAQNPAMARRAADALSFAVRHGASVSNEPDDDVISGLKAHLAVSPADHIVVGTPTTAGRHRWFRRSMLASIKKQFPGLVIHIAPAAVVPGANKDVVVSEVTKPDLRQHLLALGLVAITLASLR